MEKMAGDLLLGSKFVKLSILPTLLVHLVYGRLGESGAEFVGLNV